MEKTLIVFGAYGALGQRVKDVLLAKKVYKKIYLLDFKVQENVDLPDHVVNIKIADLSVEQNVSDAFEKIPLKVDNEFFLFSTVGGFTGGFNLVDTTEQDWGRMFNINLKSNFLIAKYFYKLAQTNGGAICFTSALTGFNPEQGKIAYGASKSALNYLINSLSLEWAQKKVAVMGVAPHTIDTPANREWEKNYDYDLWQKPEEIGNLVHFLFANYHYLSGNIITLQRRFKR